jgi:hypothetical protein
MTAISSARACTSVRTVLPITSSVASASSAAMTATAR